MEGANQSNLIRAERLGPESQQLQIDSPEYFRPRILTPSDICLIPPPFYPLYLEIFALLRIPRELQSIIITLIFEHYTGSARISLCSGNHHFLLLTQDVLSDKFSHFINHSIGRVFSWGSNTFGQLGIGNYETSFSPVFITRLPDISMIGCNDNFSMALSREGKVYGWGDNSHGQIGSPMTNSNIPYLIDIQEKITFISCAGRHSMALTGEGYLYEWGRYESNYVPEGELDKLLQRSLEPKRLKTRLGLATEKLICFGWSFYQQSLERKGLVYIYSVDDLFQHFEIPIQNIKSLCCTASSSRHSLVIDSDGNLYSWGDNSCGQLGNGSTSNEIDDLLRFENIRDSTSNTKIGIDIKEKVSMVSSGNRHSAALTVHGELYTWGSAKEGQLGFNYPFKNYPAPRILDASFSGNVYYVSCGGDNTTVITRDGKIYTWGDFVKTSYHTQIFLDSETAPLITNNNNTSYEVFEQVTLSPEGDICYFQVD